MRITATRLSLLAILVATSGALWMATTTFSNTGIAVEQSDPAPSTTAITPSPVQKPDAATLATGRKISLPLRRQKDLRSQPVRRIVALGESTTWGYSVSSKEKCWVSQVTRMLEEFQGTKIELINSGIGSNVITPRCPAYEHSARPSALERVESDLIRYKPDFIFLSYGLNDSRGGTPVETFRAAYQELIDRIRAKINPTIVIVNTYYMHEVLYDHCPNWEHSNYEVTDVFNTAIKQIAEANGLIHADVYSAEHGVDWIIDEDHCHPNDLGHRIIANRVFEAIVRNCSFPACRMPKETLLPEFSKKYGNGPERPAARQE